MSKVAKVVPIKEPFKKKLSRLIRSNWRLLILATILVWMTNFMVVIPKCVIDENNTCYTIYSNVLQLQPVALALYYTSMDEAMFTVLTATLMLYLILAAVYYTVFVVLTAHQGGR